MGCSDFSSWIKILVPALLLLLPTAVHLLASGARRSSPATTAIFRHHPRVPRPGEDQASRALLLPQATRSSSSSGNNNYTKKVRGPVEEGLARARAAIRRAARGGGRRNGSSCSFSSPRHRCGDRVGPPNIYWNAAAFNRSYSEMEKRMKVYVYEEGEPPLVHDGPCKNIYSMEGRFIQELETMKGGLRTRNASRANLFFLPFSVAWMVKFVYVPLSHDHSTIRRFVADYIGVLASKHPYWNRTAGADHFMLSCHDWGMHDDVHVRTYDQGPSASQADPNLYTNSIRALCNANTSEGFQPQKDVSIPEIHLLTGDIPSQVQKPPPPTAPRPYLAFFAGGLHGPIRPLLLRHWQGRDPDLQVHQYLPKSADYFADYMLRSRFCLCPSGYEVASPRVAEAIYAECVPVIISKAYVLPFSDVLRWEEFSVRVEVEEIPRLKEILMAVSEERIGRMREGLREVRKHFTVNRPAERFDVFHMILHSVWLRRLNLRPNVG